MHYPGDRIKIIVNFVLQVVYLATDFLRREEGPAKGEVPSSWGSERDESQVKWLIKTDCIAMARVAPNTRMFPS